MKKSPNSHLSRRILLTLSREPASSITALARDLESIRSSVSRSVKSLQEAGLIARDGRTLSLTEAGQEEVKRLRDELPGKVKKTTDLATRILEEATKTAKKMEAGRNLALATRALKSLDFSTLTSAMKAAQALQAIDINVTRQAQQAAQLLDAFDFSIIKQTQQAAQLIQAFDTPAIWQTVQSMKVFEPSILSPITEAINAVAQIQMVNLDYVRLWDSQVLLPQSQLLIENNAFMSAIIADLDAIARMDIGINSSLRDILFKTTEVTRAYDILFRSAIDAMARHLPQEQTLVGSLRIGLVTPTAATTSVVSAARGVIESQITSEIEEQSVITSSTRIHVYSEQYTAMTIVLESRLKTLGERFVNKWHGAWQTLFSESEDRYSQATHSGRELLIQVLEFLAPDDLFTEEECKEHNVRKPSRRMQVKRILNTNDDTTISWVDKLAAALDGTYDMLTAQSHRRDDKPRYDNIASAQLLGLGNLLLFLLDWRGNNLTLQNHSVEQSTEQDTSHIDL